MKKKLTAVFLILLFATPLFAMGQGPASGESAAEDATKKPTMSEKAIENMTGLQTGYDGLWFLGFNHHKDLFSDRNGIQVKKAIGLAINRKHIAKKMVGEPITPDSMIPVTMSGYQSGSLNLSYSAKDAKALMRKAGYSMQDKRIKNLALLHTDGVKTIEIAKKIKQDLAAIGMRVDLVQVSYRDEEKWQSALESGKMHLFLMGYKATKFGSLYIGDKKKKIFHTIGCPKIPDAENQEFFGSYGEAIKAGYAICKTCYPKPEPSVSTFDLLEPLFASDGSANFTFYQNDRVDNLINQLSIMDESLLNERRTKFIGINEVLCKELPAIPLFYIQKI